MYCWIHLSSLLDNSKFYLFIYIVLEEFFYNMIIIIIYLSYQLSLLSWHISHLHTLDLFKKSIEIALSLITAKSFYWGLCSVIIDLKLDKHMCIRVCNSSLFSVYKRFINILEDAAWRVLETQSDDSIVMNEIKHFKMLLEVIYRWFWGKC